MNSRAKRQKDGNDEFRGKRLQNDKARSRTRVNIGSDQLSSAGEISRSGRPAIRC